MEHIQFLQRRIYDLNQHHNHLTIPTVEEVYQDIKLGIFWHCIKQGRHNKLYPLLSQNEILKNDYERVQKLKEEKK
jgi:hypothetical protein